MLLALLRVVCVVLYGCGIYVFVCCWSLLVVVGCEW